MTVVVYIGLGSNLGDSRQIFLHAIEQLNQHGRVDAVSALYASKPLGPQDQPDFLNAAVRLITSLSADTLLGVLQAVEQDAGRVKKRHWGERTLDLDILFYGDEQIQTPHLTVPHVGILERAFVVLPLLDLDPDLTVGAIALKDAPVAKPSTDIVLLQDKRWIDNP